MFGFDIHSHSSEHSACSHVSAEELIDTAIERGLAGMVVTDHHYQWPRAELQAIAERLKPGAIVMLSAYELTTADRPNGKQKHAGDLLIYGAPDGSEMELWTPYKEACARAREQNALIISAHPFREGAGAGERIFDMDIDGIEIFNPNHSQLDVSRAKAAVLRAGFLGVAGSDAHHASHVGQFPTIFDRPVRDMNEFIRELRARRYAIQSNCPGIR